MEQPGLEHHVRFRPCKSQLSLLHTAPDLPTGTWSTWLCADCLGDGDGKNELFAIREAVAGWQLQGILEFHRYAEVRYIVQALHTWLVLEAVSSPGSQVMRLACGSPSAWGPINTLFVPETSCFGVTYTYWSS